MHDNHYLYISQCITTTIFIFLNAWQPLKIANKTVICNKFDALFTDIGINMSNNIKMPKDNTV